MTITRTTLLDLPVITTGTESGVWGDITNNGLTQYLDIAIAGMTSLTSANFTAGALTIETTEGNASSTNITSTSAQYAGFRVSSLATNSTITVGNTGSAVGRSYRIINADTTYTLTFKATGQTGVTFQPGTSGLIAFNGTDYVLIGMVGPATATDNAVARFDGTSGRVVQNSAVTIADTTGDITTSGYVITAAGAAGTAAYTTSGDLNTGMFFPAADTVAFTEGGTEVMRIDSSGNVGIGTTSAGSKLDVKGTLRLSGSSSGYVGLAPAAAAGSTTYTLPSADGTSGQFLSTNGSGTLSWATASGGGGGGGTSVTVTQITATASQTTFNVTYTVGQISVYLNGALLASADYTASNGTTVVLGTGAASGDIFTAVVYSSVTQIIQGDTSVAVSDSGSNGTITFTTDNSERMRITSAGNVGIGTTSPSSGASWTYVTVAGKSTTQGGVVEVFNSDATLKGQYYAFNSTINIGASTNHPLIFLTNNAERARFNAGAPILCLSGGNTSATGTGIAFPATQSASSDANTLDDYEEGTWTPSIGGTATYVRQDGWYQKIGNTVYYQLNVLVTTRGTGSQTTITGFPFSTSVNIRGWASYWLTTSQNIVYMAALGSGATQIDLYTATAASASLTVNNVIGNNTEVIIVGFYTV